VLNARQRQLIVELVRAPTIRAACRTVGIDERQCHRWRRLPEFAQALAAAREEAFCEGLAEIKASVRRAGRTLNKCLAAKDAGDRIRASKVLLDTAVKAVELLDLVKRVERLEQRHGAGDTGPEGGGPGAGGGDADGGEDAGGDPA
jgi:hypothetical protein